jgi:DNA-directed RNA polymerase III subunit RPC6
MLDSSPVVRNPCGICPVFKDCHDDGLITPETCIYLNKWLDF